MIPKKAIESSKILRVLPDNSSFVSPKGYANVVRLSPNNLKEYVMSFMLICGIFCTLPQLSRDGLELSISPFKTEIFQAGALELLSSEDPKGTP